MNTLSVGVFCVVVAVANAGLIGGGIITNNISPAIIPNTLIQTVDTKTIVDSGAIIEPAAKVATKEAETKSDDSVVTAAADEAPVAQIDETAGILPASTTLLTGPAITTSIIRAPLTLSARTIALSPVATPFAAPLGAPLLTPLAAPLAAPWAAPLISPLATPLAGPAIITAHGEGALIAGPSGTIATGKNAGLGLASGPAILPAPGLITRSIITNPGIIAAPGLIAARAW